MEELEVDKYFDSLSNRGRWGEDDRIGTLNLITPEVRAAASLVETGEAVSLSRDIDPLTPDTLGPGSPPSESSPAGMPLLALVSPWRTSWPAGDGAPPPPLPG